MKKLSLMMTLMICTPLVFASKGPHSRHHFKEMMEQLDLSQEQMDKMKEFQSARKGKRKEIKISLRETRSLLKNSFIKGDNDTLLEAHHERMKGLHGQKADLKFKKLLFLKSMLTAEQRTQFMELKKKSKRKYD